MFKLEHVDGLVLSVTNFVTPTEARDYILNKIHGHIVDYKLTNKEIDFILSKLRESNYKGFEFEIFYAVWVKLNEHKTKE